MALQQLHTGDTAATGRTTPDAGAEKALAVHGYCIQQHISGPAPYNGTLLASLPEIPEPFFYFRDPFTGLELLATGCITSFESSEIEGAGFYRQALQAATTSGVTPPFPVPLAFCYAKIYPDGRSGTWKDYATSAIVIPRFTAAARDGMLYTASNRLITGHARHEQAGTGETEPLSGNRAPLPYTGEALRGDSTDAAFLQEAAAIRDAIISGSLRKGVAAKRSVYTFSNTPTPAGVLLNLSVNEPGSTLFAVRSGETCFLGATPERLFSLRGNRLVSESIAGTTRRGATAEEDARLARALLNSGKERLEQQVVTAFITDALAQLSDDVTVSSEPGIKKLSRVQHLYTRVEARMRAGTGFGEAIEALFPTPATCGMPRGDARDFIRTAEGFDRGLYTGTIGWCTPDGQAEFLVAIRCGLLRGNSAELFAGCGIVADSDPQSELAEAELKTASIIEGWTCKT